MKKYFIPLALILLLSRVSFGQKTEAIAAGKQSDFVLGKTDSIESRVLGEKRALNIYLPDGYNPDSAATYPVIYLLDGSRDEDFIHVAGIIQFLTMIDTMPKVILVGIANVDRRRDYTYPTTIAEDKRDFPTTGGSALFMQYIEKEVEPYINKYYNTNGERTIIGQSLGGLVATEILLKHPQLFDNYVIVSPSLWWDNESLLKAAPGYLKNNPDADKKIFIVVGTEGEVMEGDAEQLYHHISDTKRSGYMVRFTKMPEEDHLTILHNCIYKTLIKLYGER